MSKLVCEGWRKFGQRKKELGEEKALHKANRACSIGVQGSLVGLDGWSTGLLQGRVPLLRPSRLGVPAIPLKTLMTVFGKLFGDKKVFFSQSQMKIR